MLLLHVTTRFVVAVMWFLVSNVIVLQHAIFYISNFPFYIFLFFILKEKTLQQSDGSHPKRLCRRKFHIFFLLLLGNVCNIQIWIVRVYRGLKKWMILLCVTVYEKNNNTPSGI